MNITAVTGTHVSTHSGSSYFTIRSAILSYIGACQHMIRVMAYDTPTPCDKYSPPFIQIIQPQYEQVFKQTIYLSKCLTLHMNPHTSSCLSRMVVCTSSLPRSSILLHSHLSYTSLSPYQYSHRIERTSTPSPP